MENNNLNYIPYGAAALGAVLGNVLYKKYPKFGTAGRLLAIGIGAVSGYYISDKIIGGDGDDFLNAVGAGGGGISDKKCAQYCKPNDAMRDINTGKCVCVPKLTVQPGMAATRNFYSDAVGSWEDRAKKRRCKAYANNKFDCHRLAPWNPATCQCEPKPGL